MHTRRHRGCDYVDKHGNHGHRHSQQRARDRAQRRPCNSDGRVSAVAKVASASPPPASTPPAALPTRPVASDGSSRLLGNGSSAQPTRLDRLAQAACCDEVSSESSASSASASWRARSTRATTPADRASTSPPRRSAARRRSRPGRAAQILLGDAEPVAGCRHESQSVQGLGSCPPVSKWQLDACPPLPTRRATGATAPGRSARHPR